MVNGAIEGERKSMESSKQQQDVSRLNSSIINVLTRRNNYKSVQDGANARTITVVDSNGIRRDIV